MRIDVRSLTTDRWPDLEALFGPQGADGGCWCMWFRIRSKEMERNTNADNKRALKAIVDSGQPPGLLAYVDGNVAAWVSLGPRERFQKLVHGGIWKPLDDTPVWSIVCFVVGKEYRRRGMMSTLLAAAMEYGRKNGATMFEAYPVEPEKELAGYEGFTGVRRVFERAGFREAGRMSNGRPVMRREA